MEPRDKANWLCAALILGFVAAFALQYGMTQYAQKDYPEGTFLFRPSDRGVSGQIFPARLGVHGFGDFYEVWANSRNPAPYVEHPLSRPGAGSYLPLTYILFWPLAQASFAVALYLYLAAICLVLAAAVFWALGGRPLSERALVATALTALSGPLIFLIDRGNVEGLVTIGIAVAVFASLRGRWRLAAAALSVPIAMKATPIVLLGLFLVRRRWAEAAMCLALSVALVLGALWVFPGTMSANAAILWRGLTTVPIGGLSEIHAIQHAVGLHAFLGALAHYSQPAAWLAHHYVIAMAVVAVALTVAAISVRRSLWRLVTVLIVGLLLLPPMSYEYRMINLIVPLILFLRAEERGRSDPWIVGVYAILLMPKQWPMLFSDVGIGSIVNPAGLIVLAVLVTVHAPSVGRGVAGPPDESRDAARGPGASSPLLV